MKFFASLKSKLILALVLTALVPLVPLTLVVKGLIERSLEVGLNEQAEDAFESALELAQENYNFRKQTVITQAELIANLYDMRKPFIENDRRNLQIAVVEWSDNLKLQAIELYDAEGNFVMEAVSPDIVGFKGWETKEEHVLEAIEKGEPYVPILEQEKVVKAFAPIFDYRNRIIGTVVVTQIVEPAYAEARNKVSEAVETYKYLELIRGKLTRNFMITFFLFAVVISFLATFVGLLITRRISKSITELLKGTKELAKGNLDHKITAVSHDEIATLVSAFNSMAATMKENRKRLLHSERVAAWQEVARKIAHEIKNPLTPIQLSIQHLKDRYYQESDDYADVLEQCTETISEEVESLRTMVKSFSEFARMPKPDPHPTNVNHLINTIISIYRESHPEIDFVLSLSPELPEMNLDPNQIKRVLHNLIANSVDAMHPKGRILRISTRMGDADDGIIEVEDSGSGIPEENIDKIFEPYFTTKSKGTGLGLAIVNRIIKDHFGEIEFHNTEIGVKCIIKLPVNFLT